MSPSARRLALGATLLLIVGVLAPLSALARDAVDRRDVVGGPQSCGDPGWLYVASTGVYFSACQDPFNDPTREREVKVEYDPYAIGGGPCWHVFPGVEGRTDVCADTFYWFGEWKECLTPLKGGYQGVYGEVCWNGSTDRAVPGVGVTSRPEKGRCVEVKRPGLDGSSTAACINGL